MALTPGNPVVGGEFLRRAAIESPNYVPATSGWSINQDGSAEFNNGTFRGTVTAGIFKGTDFIINASGAFFYSGPPAAGNLVASIAAADGTDAFGNAYLSEVVNYKKVGSTFYAASFTGADVQFFQTSNPAGPWTPSAGISGQGNTFNIFSEGPLSFLTIGPAPGPIQVDGTGGGLIHAFTTQFLVSLTNVPALTSALLEVQGQVAATASGGPVIHAITTAPTSGPIVRADGTVAGDASFGAQVTGDSSARLRVNADGNHGWGPGSGGQDTVLYRAAAGELAVSTIVADISGSPETWHVMPAMANGWSAAGAGAEAKYMLTPEGDLKFLFVNLGPGTRTDNTAIWAAGSLPAAYRPSINTRWPCSMGGTTLGFAGTASPQINFVTDGSIAIQGLNAGGTLSRIDAAGILPLG